MQVKMNYTTVYAGTRYSEGNTYQVTDEVGIALASGSVPAAVIINEQPEVEVKPKPAKAQAKKRK
jgi:hypothetical protein